MKSLIEQLRQVKSPANLKPRGDRSREPSVAPPRSAPPAQDFQEPQVKRNLPREEDLRRPAPPPLKPASPPKTDFKDEPWIPPRESPPRERSSGRVFRPKNPPPEQKPRLPFASKPIAPERPAPAPVPPREASEVKPSAPANLEPAPAPKPETVKPEPVTKPIVESVFDPGFRTRAPADRPLASVPPPAAPVRPAPDAKPEETEEEGGSAPRRVHPALSGAPRKTASFGLALGDEPDERQEPAVKDEPPQPAEQASESAMRDSGRKEDVPPADEAPVPQRLVRPPVKPKNRRKRKPAPRAPEAAVPPINTRPAIAAGLLIIAVTFGGFGTWAAVATLDSAVIAGGTVKVFSNRKKIQHAQGGIVTEILVKNGDTVEAGQVLLRLDKTEAAASAGVVRVRYETVRAAMARLEAERDGAEKVVYPPELEVKRDDPDIAEVLEGQEQLFDARRASLKERLAQLEEEIRGTKVQMAARDRQIKLIEEELTGLKALHEKGYASKTRILALEREQQRLIGERGERQARIAQTETQILQLKEEFRERVMTELREQTAQYLDLEERANAAEFWLDQTDMKAPVAGVIVSMNAFAQGQVIKPGETIVEIVPIDDALIVEAQVRPINIDDITVGQAAEVMLTAFSQRSTPRLKGEVAYVAADILVDEKTGQSYYTARITVSEEEVARLGDKKLQPGMPAEVFIKTGGRSPLNYLMQPLNDSISKAWREQ